MLNTMIVVEYTMVNKSVVLNINEDIYQLKYF